MICSKCGSKMQSRGVRKGTRNFKCTGCGAWKSVKENKDTDSEPSYSKYVNDGETIHVSFVSDHLPSKEEVAQQYKIDLNEWEIKKVETTDWQMGRKDRQVNLKFENGISNGNVVDSGQINRVWLHRINVTFVRKTQEIRTKGAIYDMKIESLSFAPRYPKISYPKLASGVMYEIGMPDIHFGLLTWDKETGQDYDIDIARKTVIDGVGSLLQSAKSYPVERILFPVGNDFFNVNNKDNTTVHNTPQSEDTRWQKTFREGRRLLTDAIDMCASVAPVDVIVIPGNHDEERMFYLGDSLESWYHKCPNVSIDNSPKSRKYYLYGCNLIGLAHGYYEPVNKLPLIMAKEAKDMWAKSTYQEWHLGDKHHKKDMFMLADEGGGMMVRILRAISPSSAWTFNKGFLSTRAAEGFVWNKEDGGVIAQFTHVSR